MLLQVTVEDILVAIRQVPGILEFSHTNNRGHSPALLTLSCPVHRSR